MKRSILKRTGDSVTVIGSHPVYMSPQELKLFFDCDDAEIERLAVKASALGWHAHPVHKGLRKEKYYPIKYILFMAIHLNPSKDQTVQQWAIQMLKSIDPSYTNILTQTVKTP